jgi:hypothetical protein
MLLVRIGRKGRWLGSDSSADTAVKDLGLRPDELGLSVYRVDNMHDAINIAKVHAPTARKKVDKIDFILFDENILGAIYGLELIKTPSSLHPQLSEVHHEILGLDPERAQLLAEAILGSPFCAERISADDLIESVRSRIADDDAFKSYIYDDWYSSATD